MRVLHATDCYLPGLGGIETHVSDLASRQSRRGDVVAVATAAPASVDGQTLPDVGPVRVLRLENGTEPLGGDLSGYDVVHAHLSAVSPFASRVASRAARAGVPTVVTVHSLWSGLGPLPTLSAGVHGLWFAPVVWTAVSRAAAELLRPALPGGVQVRVVPNAVDASPRPSTPPGNDGLRIVSTMRLASRKRPVQLLRMAAALRRRTTTPLRLLLVGDGPLRPALERVADRKGLTDLVTITGRLPRPDVLREVASADLYVAPATRESFGIAALEARTLGLPVVGRSGTGLSEFITHDQEGLLAESDRQMVAWLQRLVDDADLRWRIAEHNRTTPTTMTWRYALARNDAAYAQAARQVSARSQTSRRLLTRELSGD